MKNTAVEKLQLNDKFEFLSEKSASSGDSRFGRASGAMIVTRAPQVNPAANSCFFRYSAIDEPNGESRSFNGVLGLEVGLLVDKPEPKPTAKPTADAVDSEKVAAKPIRKKAAKKTASPVKKKSATKKTATKRAAVSTAAAKKPAKKTAKKARGS